MTRTRALLGALAVGSLSLGLATGASAQAVNTITGTNSQVDAGCLGLLQVVGNPRCQYDDQAFPPGIFPGAGDSTGPIAVGSYYAVGSSPWDDNGGPGDVGGTIGDGKYEAPLIGTVTIDDKGTPCDADDTITADIGYGAATRNFAGGPGTQGEETWGDGDLSFQLAETVVSSATPNGGGCDYVIGDAGAPPLLTTAGGGEYGDDLDIGVTDIWIPNNGAGAYTGTTPTISTLEVNANTGAPLTVTNGPTYSCVFFSGGAVDCTDTGSHHEVATSDMGQGDRGAIENSIWVISTDASGNITSGTAYPVSENPVGGFSQPQWLAPRWSFTGTTGAGGGATAADDAASTLTDTAVDINVLANDTGFGDPVTVTVTVAPTIAGATAIVNNPGMTFAPQDITYTPAAGAAGEGTDTFTYEVTDGTNTDTAVVTVTIAPNAIPVSPDGALTLDTQGQQGAAAAESLNVSTLPGYVAGDAPLTCTITAQGTNGTASCTGTTVTYTPDDAFVEGGDVDTFTYQIEDAQGDTDTGDISVDIADVSPLLSYAALSTEANTAGDSAATVTPGNGTPAQHTIALTTDATNGACVVNGITSVTYTPDADYEGADTCSVTLTDADGDAVEATVAITVTAPPPSGGNEGDLRLPGGKSALGLWSLILLGGLPLLRRRQQR